jgi:hypothetical protein
MPRAASFNSRASRRESVQFTLEPTARAGMESP